MSRASKHIPIEKPVEYSKISNKEAIAEPTEHQDKSHVTQKPVLKARQGTANG